jgi:predicted DNA-binding protein
MGADDSITFLLPADLHAELLRVSGRLNRDKSKIIRACIRVALRRVEDPATLIDLLEAGELDNQRPVGGS